MSQETYYPHKQPAQVYASAKSTVFAGHTVYKLPYGQYKIEGRIPTEQGEFLAFFENKLSSERMQMLRLWMGLECD